MKKVGKWLFCAVIVVIVAFVIYAVVMAYQTSQEWTLSIYFNDNIVRELNVENGEIVQSSDILSQLEIDGYQPIALYDNAELLGEPISSLTVNDDISLYLLCEEQ